MSAIKRVWIDPYNAETGSDLFIKTYSPKQFVLVGSVEYNVNGTVVLGQAEGGNNIAYFDINQNFDKNNVTSIQRMIQTSHHEFAHILHQTVMYPEEFKYITSNLGFPGYTATWFNVSKAQALAWGYVTPYSMASYDEDFVEMIANMLMLGRTRFDEVVASTNAAAQQSLRAKEQIVVNYFRQVWNIDFYSLQTRVQAALNSLVPPPPASEAWGFGKTYGRASVNPAPTNQVFLPQPAAFLSIYNAAKTGLAAVGGAGRILDSFALINNTASTVLLRIYYKNAAGNPTQGNYQYAVSKSGTGVYTFTYGGADANGAVILTGVAPLVNYFSNNTFTLSWYRDPGVSLFPRIQFTPQASPGTYFLARLLP
jgi:substrate import-associated zinc metallohydrolase lipoprotein